MSLDTENAQLSQLAILLQAMIDVLPSVVEGQLGFETTADLVADAELTGSLAAGRKLRIFEHDGFDLVRIDSGTAHYTAATGAAFRVAMEVTSPAYFGAEGDGVSDDTAALDLADGSDALSIDLRGRSYVYSGAWSPAKPVTNGQVIDDTKTHDYRAKRGIDMAADADLSAITPQNEDLLVTLSQAAQMISDALSANNSAIQGEMVINSSQTGARVANGWTRRDLNTIEANTITGAALAANQISLPAGRYRFVASAAFFDDLFAVRLRLQDIVNDVTVGLSPDATAWSAANVYPTITVERVFAAPVTLELQYYTGKARAGDGLGTGSLLPDHRYAHVQISKIS